MSWIVDALRFVGSRFVPVWAFAGWAPDGLMGHAGNPLMMTPIALPLLDEHPEHGVLMVAYR